MKLKKEKKGKEREERGENPQNANKEKWMKIFKEFEPKRENIISILHCIQTEEKFNHIPEEAVHTLADYLHISPSEVYGVASFYTMFSVTPRGKYIVRVCASAPCHIMGSTTVIEALKEILGIAVGETTEDNLFTLESSSCLGLCDGAPAMMINDEVFRDLTGEKVKKILEGKYYE